MDGARQGSVGAGRLDRRLKIEVMGPEINDGLGPKPGGWLALCTRWAELTPLSGAERVAAAENAAFETLKFRIRRDSVTEAIGPKTHRVRYNRRTYDIQGRLEVGKRALDLLVAGRADQTPSDES